MVQDSLVEYINSQMKTGISRDAIKASLVGAGWQTADVEDTQKKVEASKPASGGVSPQVSASPAKPAEPQTIKMSDLVSAAPSKSTSFSSSPFVMGKDAKVTAAPTKVEPVSSSSSGRHVGGLIMYIVAGVLIVGLGALAVMFYMQNSTLSAKVASLGGQSATVTANLSSLTSQVQALNASNTAFAAQVATLSASNQSLQTDLSFYAVPPGTVATTTSLSVTGTVSGGGKALYALTTSDGAKIYVANSKDPSVMAAMLPLVASAGPAAPASSTQLTGTYVPGSDIMTVTAINGSSV